MNYISNRTIPVMIELHCTRDDGGMTMVTVPRSEVNQYIEANAYEMVDAYDTEGFFIGSTEL